MAKPSSPTASEGFGFTYADKVGALALLALLGRAGFAEQQFGVVTKVQFGQRPAGWHFDDLLLTLESNAQERRLACSIKSTNHVSNAGLSKDIVELAWQQTVDIGPFDESLDALALIQPSPSTAVRDDLAELYRWSTRQEAGQLEDWLQPLVAAKLKRSIVDSVRLNDRGLGEAQRFFQFFRAIFLDMDEPYDQTVRQAQNTCMSLLENPTEARAQALWTHLCQLAAEARGSAGTLTLTDLISKLTPHFVFREHPRVEQDLLRLRQFSTDRHLASVRDVIGSDLRLPTHDAVDQIEGAFEKAPVVVFLGSSGSGKSVVLKNFVANSLEGELRLYFRADLSSVSPSAIERHLSLQHRLMDCLTEGMFGHITLVIDQVDRLMTDDQIADVLELLTSSKSHRPLLRVVFGCQSAEAERVLSRLSQALPSSEVARVLYTPDEEAMFQAVIERFPTLRNIAFRTELRRIFLSAKNLDLLVGRLDKLGHLSAQQVTSQKQFIDWFWDMYVSDGQHGIARATMMRQLADVQAATLSPHVDPASIDDRQALDLLRGADLVTGDDQGVTFQHDLYGDWARLRTIEANQADVNRFLHERGTNPLWLRAIRLWSAILLETKGAAHWQRQFDAFSESDGPGWMIRDAMLDGLALAAGSDQYLRELRDILFEEDGKLLKRFLARFLFATTWPNDRLAQAFSKGDSKLLATYRSQFRIPQWYLWWPVIRFIVSDVASGKVAPKLVVEILVSWLGTLPKDIETGDDASRLALSIAESFLSAGYTSRKDETYSMHVCRCTFLALKHVPDEAQEILRRALGLVGEDQYKDAEKVGGERYVKSHSYMGSGKARIVGPWPKGPIAVQNRDFRKFVLMGGGFSEAYAFSPAFAREIVLAALMEPPHEEEPDRDWSGMMLERAMCLADDRTFYPPMYDSNLFQVMLAADAEFAVDLIIQLTDFATDRWHEMLLRHGQDDSVKIKVNGKARVFTGNFDAYGWHRNSGHCPNVLIAALMTLEKFLYDQIDAGNGERWLTRLIDSMRSTAILGLLASVGRKYPTFFATTLRFLHFSEWIQWWDINLVIRGEGHQMIAWQLQPELAVKRAREWHEMSHRRFQSLKFYAFYVLNHPEGRKEALTNSRRWKRSAKRANNEDQGGLENLAVIYDYKSYSAKQEEDRVVIQCNLPADMRQAADEHLASSERSFKPMLLAHKCRELLSGEPQLADGDLRDLHAQAVAIRREDLVQGMHVHAEDAWCGVSAVLLIQYPDWLGTEPAIRDWCIETLLTTCLNPPPPSEFEVASSVSEDQWCHFAAQAIPRIWAERPDDAKLIECIANLIEDFRYKTVAYLAKPIFALRATRPELYYRAVALHRAWAVNLTRKYEVERRSHVMEQDLHLFPPLVEETYSGIRRAFLDGTLPLVLEALPEPDIPPVEERGSAIHDRRRATPKVDTMRLGSFVVNLPLVDTLGGPDQEEVTQRWSELFHEVFLEIRGNPDDPGRSVNWYSHEWELFAKFGYFTASLTDSKVAEDFLISIRQVIPYAEHHAEQFFDGYFNRLLRTATVDELADSNWQLALEIILGTKNPTAESWKKEYGWHEWEDWLVGNTQMLRNYWWNESHQSFVAKHESIYESWVKSAARNARSMVSCLRFLSLPASGLIRNSACVWIRDAMSEGLLDDRNENLADGLAAFLESARPSVSASRKKLPKVFEAYLDLLAILNRRNNRLAMQLLEDVATLQ